ncbi:unnamed protein product, partial [Mesorhabditis spiculigera]
MKQLIPTNPFSVPEMMEVADRRPPQPDREMLIRREFQGKARNKMNDVFGTFLEFQNGDTPAAKPSPRHQFRVDSRSNSPTTGLMIDKMVGLVAVEPLPPPDFEENILEQPTTSGSGSSSQNNGIESKPGSSHTNDNNLQPPSSRHRHSSGGPTNRPSTSNHAKPFQKESQKISLQRTALANAEAQNHSKRPDPGERSIAASPAASTSGSQLESGRTPGGGRERKAHKSKETTGRDSNPGSERVPEAVVDTNTASTSAAQNEKAIAEANEKAEAIAAEKKREKERMRLDTERILEIFGTMPGMISPPSVFDDLELSSCSDSDEEPSTSAPELKKEEPTPELTIQKPQPEDLKSEVKIKPEIVRPSKPEKEMNGPAIQKRPPTPEEKMVDNRETRKRKLDDNTSKLDIRALDVAQLEQLISAIIEKKQKEANEGEASTSEAPIPSRDEIMSDVKARTNGPSMPAPSSSNSTPIPVREEHNHVEVRSRNPSNEIDVRNLKATYPDEVTGTISGGEFYDKLARSYKHLGDAYSKKVEADRLKRVLKYTQGIAYYMMAACECKHAERKLLLLESTMAFTQSVIAELEPLAANDSGRLRNMLRRGMAIFNYQHYTTTSKRTQENMEMLLKMEKSNPPRRFTNKTGDGSISSPSTGNPSELIVSRGIHELQNRQLRSMNYLMTAHHLWEKVKLETTPQGEMHLKKLELVTGHRIELDMSIPSMVISILTTAAWLQGEHQIE